MNWKAIIAGALAGLAQFAKVAFNLDISPGVIDALTAVLLFVAGLFIKAPDQKKS